MESRCVAKYIRVAPRKLRLVADLVRGKNVNEAISLLKFTPKAGSRPALKAIQSAVANVVNKDDKREVDPDTLFVHTIFVDEGPTLKRYLPRAMGRATPIRKHLSHLTVLVATPAEEAAPTEEAGAETTAETAEAKGSRKPRVKKATSKKTATAKAAKGRKSAAKPTKSDGKKKAK